MASTLQHRSGVLGVGGAAMRALRRLSRYVAIAVLSLVILLGAGVAVTQTSWFKNWLRQKAVSQAAQYLNGELTITRLSGNIFTGVVLEGVALRHEGQTAVAMDRLTVELQPADDDLGRADLRFDDAATIPTILLQRDNAGWNFSRFVKTRRNTGGRGAPPITMQSIAINNGHLIVQRSRPARRRPHPPQHAVPFRVRKAWHRDLDRPVFCRRSEMTVRRLAGDLRFDRGSMRARDLAIETDRTKLVTAISYSGPQERLLELQLDAERLSLPEIGRYFRPLANIRPRARGRR